MSNSYRLFLTLSSLSLAGVVSVLQVEASICNTDTTPIQPHRNTNTHRTKNNTTNVVIQLNSRKLLMTDVLMSETCWAHKKWNNIASDIKLVFLFSMINFNLLFFFLHYNNRLILIRFYYSCLVSPKFVFNIISTFFPSLPALMLDFELG